MNFSQKNCKGLEMNKKSKENPRRGLRPIAQGKDAPKMRCNSEEPIKKHSTRKWSEGTEAQKEHPLLGDIVNKFDEEEWEW